jgi:peptide/nickel transport system permease protein
MTALVPVDLEPAGAAEPTATPAVARTRGRLRLRDHRGLVAGVAILVVVVLVGLIGPFLLGDPLDTDPMATLQSPSWDHPFGTDQYGRDVLTRAVYAARLDVGLGLATSLAAMVVGTAIGVVAGFWGGRLGGFIMRTVDVLLAFPGFVLAMLLVAALGNTIPKVMFAVGLAFVPYFVRLTRAQVLAEREQEYVDGARLAGATNRRIAFRHVLPNALRPSIVQSTLCAGWAILNVSGLAFLGVGIRQPTPEWGVMVSEGTSDVIVGVWWTSLFPGALIVLVVAAFHMIGDDLGDRR